MGYVVDLAGNVRGLAEEIVGFVFESLPRPGDINDGIYGNVGYMHAFWAGGTGYALHQDSLRSFGWGECGIVGHASIG